MKSLKHPAFFIWLLLAIHRADLAAPTSLLGAEVPSPSLESPMSLLLDYRELDAPVWTVAIESLPSAALKNALKKLPLGNDAGFRYFLFEGLVLAWDRPGRRLFVDLNGNRDLTDDLEGIFRQSEAGELFTKFAGLRLRVPCGKAEARVLVDLNLSESNGRIQGHAAVKSLYEGRLECGGKSWQVGFIQDLSWKESQGQGGNLKIRPWEERDESLDSYLHLMGHIPGIGSLFLQGVSFGIDGSFLSSEGITRFRLDLTPRRVPLGELALGGEHVGRLLLVSDEQEPVLVAEPGPLVKVPIGTYVRQHISLKSGGDVAVCDLREMLAVGKASPARLRAGEPLANVVTLERRGGSLILQYRFLDNRGNSIRWLDQSRRKPPEFTISQGDRIIAKGAFKFG